MLEPNMVPGVFAETHTVIVAPQITVIWIALAIQGKPAVVPGQIASTN